MIRVPLNLHRPEMVYDYLEKNIGPHSMLVRNGQAIVNFIDPHHTEIALKDYHSRTLNGFILRLYPFKEEDFDKPATQPVPQPIPVQVSEMVPEPTSLPEQTPAYQISQTLKMIDEAITVKDTNDEFQVTTRKHFKDVLESVAKYQPFFTTLKLRQRELSAGEGEKSTKDLLRFAESQMNDIKGGVMGLYKKARLQLTRFGKKKENCEIDLDPALCPEPVEAAPLNAGKLQCGLHFSNKDTNIQVKKLAALNDRQFVCTNYLIDKERKQPARGRIKVYDVGEEFELMSATLPEGSYGLAVADKYLLVGNLEGSMSFWNSSQGPFSPDHPFQISPKLHNGYIFEVLRNGNRPGGFGIVTLGLDYHIKVFDVSEDLITEDVVTLFFKEEACFSEGREIMAIEILEERSRLAAGSWNKLITYDLPTRKQVAESIQRANIFRIKLMRPNLLAVASTTHLSFADPRTTPAIATTPLSQEVKALCPLSDNVVAYGTSEGQIGMIDIRKPSTPFWRDQGTHQSRIYDILRMGDKLISGDQKGLLVGWNCVN